MGLSVWTIATALGVVEVLRSSATVYDVLKLVGALYLVSIGLRALWASRRSAAAAVSRAVSGRVLDSRGGFRQGLLSNLANPKVGVFFTSLLPQFVSSHAAALPQMLMLMLGAIFISFNLVWMSSYALAAVRLSHVLNRTRVKAAIDRVSGLVLVGVGVGLALER